MSVSTLTALLFATSISIAAPEAAPDVDWALAFPADAVASHLAASDIRVAVVPVGDGTAEVAAALETSLRGLDATSLVMDGSSLGDVSALPDAEIVGKAQGLPIELVAVVRVFPGKSGGSTAVVSLYDKSGASVGGFSAAPDSPVAAKEGAPAGVDATSTTVAVAAVMQDNAEDKELALEEFMSRVVWFKGGDIVHKETGTVLGKWSQAYQGKYEVPLIGRHFYQYIGDDAATKKFMRTNIIASVVGLSVAAGGGVAASIGWPQMEKNGDVKGTVLSIGGLSAVGLGVYVGLRPWDPFTQAERRKMADDYNKALLEELGLTKEDLQKLSAPVSEAPRMAPFAAPVVLPGGGGVVLGATF